MAWIKQHWKLLTGILVGIIILIIFLLFRKKSTPATLGSYGQLPKADGTCDTGLVLVNGKCTTNSNKNLKKGDPAYVTPTYGNDLYVYSQPKADHAGTYLLGNHHVDWGNNIGTVVEVAGNTGFVKVTVKDLQISKFPGYTTLDKLTGDYYFDSNAIINTPY